LFEVEPESEIIERGEKCRADQLRIIREVKDLRPAITDLSVVFDKGFRSDMIHQQIMWVDALGRKNCDENRVIDGLEVALQSRGLEWQLKRFASSRSFRVAWDAMDARAARDARAALDVFYTAKMGWISLPAEQLTTGIRDAYSYGLGMEIPTGLNELGWVMDNK
jgi:hypothetical protein